ncbi:MAG: hypothetical protein ACRYFU_25210 [Janthinobacterium lividum]
MSSQPSVAVIAALPREIRGMIGRMTPDAGLLKQGIHLYRIESAIVVAGGMGAGRASVAFQAAKATMKIGQVISVGLAGACDAALQAGVIVEADLVVDARTGERFKCFAQDGDRPGAVLVTTDAIAGVQEKARLRAAYGAAIVDMEAATLARLAQAHGLGFRAIKGISDAHDFELASLARFAGAHGHFRTAAFAMHTAVRPHHWRHAAKLGRDSNKALATLHKRLQAILREIGSLA